MNPNFDKFIEKLPVVFVLNKADLANDEEVVKWKKKLSGANREAVSVNSTISKTSASVVSLLKKLCAGKINKFKQKGVRATVRVMIMGVPNTGKSTLTNNLCGKAKAITGNKAGVTRGKQWVKVSDTIEVIDTPGTLYPKLSDQTVAKHLAFMGSIKDEVVDGYELALALIEELSQRYPFALKNRYGIEILDTPENLLQVIARKRGFILRGNEIDLERASDAVLDDFRKGRMGKITLEGADDDEQSI
jgi:ribosome biogenesis GTPase A